MQISNPVLRGFNPDPSIIRVGEKYYIANSTFEWFPGVRLHESTDLVHWKLLPSPLNTSELIDMRGNPSSGGVWAPDLTYADGKFWLIFSDVKMVNGTFKDVSNYVTTATEITGPWSSPIKLNGVGFDASLFHDSDGRKYLVQQTWDHREYHHHFRGITLTELDVPTMKMLPKTARTIWDGDDVGLVEGPHLYKINGYYYLFAAEGGTAFEHQEVVARSKVLEERSFEGSPINPLISNYTAPRNYLQKQGHGGLVSTQRGEWYYASLCARPWRHKWETLTNPRGWSTLGRETSIQKIEWTEDGWPYVVGGVNGTQYVDAPQDAIEMKSDEHGSQHDDFTDGNLGQDWNTLRVPFDSSMGYLNERGLHLIGQGSLANTFELSLVARRWQAFNFNAETCVEFNPTTYQAMAGLTNYYNDANWSWIFVTYDDERETRTIEIGESNCGNYVSMLKDNAIAIPADIEKVWLRTKVRTSCYSYEYSFDGKKWIEIPIELDAKVLSDDYVLQTYEGFFTGAFVGLAAVDYSGYGEEATFDYFDYSELSTDQL